METLIDFLINNYIWFLVISLILIFALIGYLVDITNSNKVKKKRNEQLSLVHDNKVKEVYTDKEL